MQGLRFPAFCLQLRSDFLRDREVEESIELAADSLTPAIREHRLQRFFLRLFTKRAVVG